MVNKDCYKVPAMMFRYASDAGQAGAAKAPQQQLPGKHKEGALRGHPLTLNLKPYIISEPSPLPTGQKLIHSKCPSLLPKSASQPTPNPFREPPLPPGKGTFEDWTKGIFMAPTSEDDSMFTDSSSTLFSLYLSHAVENDKHQTDTWKAGAEGTLVFTGLFAAALATFVIDSYKSLLPDSAGNAVVLLAQISQQLGGLSNGTHIATAAASPAFLPLPPSPGQSSPPAAAVWVNSLWFLSLVISLYCALLATLQQRWARRYLGMALPHVAIHKRAHIHSFFSEGVARFHVQLAVEALPALLHVSVFLFLTGLVISLFTIHHTVAYITLSATFVGFLFYAAITVMPILYHNSPYTSPFSTLIWYISRRIAVSVHSAIYHVKASLRKIKESFARLVANLRSTTKTSPSTTPPPTPYKPVLSGSITDDIYTTAMIPDIERDARALSWTLDRLDEEGELVQFAAGIPGFSRSTKVKEAMSILEETQSLTDLHENLTLDITRLLMRAFKPGMLQDSKLLPESVRKQRVSICLEALYYLPYGVENILQNIIEYPHHPDLATAVLSMDSWLLAERLSKATTSLLDPAVKYGARCMVTVIASRPPHGEQSLSILKRYLHIDDHTLNRYLEPFDSILLKNINYFLLNTAEDAITDGNVDHMDLVLLTVHLAKQLKFEHAVLELREQFERLRTRIHGYAIDPDGTDTSRDNAEKLLSELSSVSANPLIPYSDPEPDPASDSEPRAHTWPTDERTAAAASTSARSPQTSSQNPSGQRHSQPPPNDAYISMVEVDSSPVSQHSTFPMTPSSPPATSGSG